VRRPVVDLIGNLHVVKNHSVLTEFAWLFPTLCVESCRHYFSGLLAVGDLNGLVHVDAGQHYQCGLLDVPDLTLQLAASFQLIGKRGSNDLRSFCTSSCAARAFTAIICSAIRWRCLANSGSFARLSLCPPAGPLRPSGFPSEWLAHAFVCPGQCPRPCTALPLSRILDQGGFQIEAHVEAAAATHGTSNRIETTTSNIFFQRVVILGLVNNDMIRASRMSASAMPTVVVTES
jgi:hypothetical protein